jgi:hypothetical protein
VLVITLNDEVLMRGPLFVGPDDRFIRVDIDVSEDRLRVETRVTGDDVSDDPSDDVSDDASDEASDDASDEASDDASDAESEDDDRSGGSGPG